MVTVMEIASDLDTVIDKAKETKKLKRVNAFRMEKPPQLHLEKREFEATTGVAQSKKRKRSTKGNASHNSEVKAERTFQQQVSQAVAKLTDAIAASSKKIDNDPGKSGLQKKKNKRKRKRESKGESGDETTPKKPKKETHQHVSEKRIEYKKHHLAALKENLKKRKKQRKTAKAPKATQANDQTSSEAAPTQTAVNATSSGKPQGDKSPSEKNVATPSKANVSGVSSKSKTDYGVCDPTELMRIWQKYQSAAGMSVAEKDDTCLKADYFGRCYSDEDVAKNLSSSDFLNAAFPKLQKLVANKTKLEAMECGAPYLIFVCQSAMRVIELERQLGEFKGKTCLVTKLFAKHKKLTLHQKMLSTNKYHLILGTPSRLSTLFKSRHLKKKHLHGLILDWKFCNTKEQRLIDQKEARADVLELLHAHIIPYLGRLNQKKSKKTLKIVLL